MNRKISASVFQYSFLVLFLITDVICSLVSFELAYYIRFEAMGTDYPRPTKENYIALSAIFTTLIIYFFAMSGLYKITVGRSRVDEFFKILKSIPVSMMVLLALSFFYRDFSYSRFITIVGMLLACLLVGLERMAFIALERYLLKKGHGVNRLLIAGTGPGFNQIVSRMANRPESGYRLVGYVEESQGFNVRQGVRLIGPISELERIVVEHRINVMIATMEDGFHSKIKEIVDLCDRRRIRCYLAPDMVELLVGPRQIEDICGVPLILVKGLRIQGLNAVLKRAMDLVLGGLILLMILPVLIVLTILILLDSPGPVFYMQKRVGVDGRIFWMFKFRSMRTDAEAKEGPAWSQNEDPRVTRLGGILRKYSLDELPQLLNVIKGDMSLVGPRPERPYFVDQFQKGVPRYMERHKVKSGMTGWAQCNGLRGDTSITERVQYDLFYLENWSVWFDLKILILTALDILAELRRK